jgi:hypothetical protein
MEVGNGGSAKYALTGRFSVTAAQSNRIKVCNSLFGTPYVDCFVCFAAVDNRASSEFVPILLRLVYRSPVVDVQAVTVYN